MASKAVADAVEAEVVTLYPPPFEVRVLINEEIPEPPRTETALDDGWIGLEFPPTTESLRSLGDPQNNYWTEDGAFIVHIFTASGTGQGQAAAIDEIVKAHFRGRQFGPSNEITVLDIFEADSGDRFGGNWFGISRGFGFRREFVA